MDRPRANSRAEQPHVQNVTTKEADMPDYTVPLPTENRDPGPAQRTAQEQTRLALAARLLAYHGYLYLVEFGWQPVPHNAPTLKGAV